MIVGVGVIASLLLFMTGTGHVPTVVEAMKGGALDLLSKPFTADALCAAIAREKAGQNDKDEFAHNAGLLSSGTCPAPIFALYLGDSNVETVIAAAAGSNTEAVRRRMICEANFYAGIFEREKGVEAKARELLQNAASQCPPAAGEASFAQEELRAIGP